MLKNLLLILRGRGPHAPRSLHRQLLSLSLLAVLAGYGLLLVVHGLLSYDSRRLRHQQAVDRVRQELLQVSALVRTKADLQAQLSRLVTPGMDVGLTRRGSRYNLGSAPEQPLAPVLDWLSFAYGERSAKNTALISEFRAGNNTFISSSLLFPLQGKTIELRFVSDVSQDLEQEQTVQLLLLASALTTALITGLLLRPAIRSGLQPLDDLCRRLETIQGESLNQQLLPSDRQPAELLPIVATFNRLLGRLGEAWERQRSFVNGVSHELRTPITIVGGYARRLSRSGGTLTQRQQEQIALIAAEAERMGLLVNDLLDLARSDAGHLALSDGRIEPLACLLAVQSRLQDHARGRLSLADGLEGSKLPPARGDAARVEQCLANLVENALKYTPPGSPIRLDCSSGEAGQVLLHVIDAGPGVPAADRQAIFDRFRRGSQSSGTVGSGIGLAVVQTLMHAMGGAVDVVDAPGGGADFRLHLPPAPAEASPA